MRKNKIEDESGHRSDDQRRPEDRLPRLGKLRERRRHRLHAKPEPARDSKNQQRPAGKTSERHNPHAGRALAEAASRITDRDPRPLTLVTGMFTRKDAEGFFRPFAEMRPRVIATTFEGPNAASAEEIAAAAAAVGLPAEMRPNVESAVKLALSGDGPAPHILICGGLHFAGEVLAMAPETWPT